MKKAFFLLMALAAAPAMAEPTVKLRMDVSPRDITIGDPVRCNITVIFSSALKPIPLAAPATGQFELLAALTPETRLLLNGDVEMTYPIIVTTFSTGTVPLPAFTVGFTTPDQQHVEARTQPLDINVLSLLAKHGDEGNLRPLKGTFNYRSYAWVWMLLLVLFLAGAAYIAYRVMRKQKGETTEDAGPPIPPEEAAFAALRELENSDLLANGNVKEYYIGLSAIARTYLAQRFNNTFMERTTSELLAEVRKLDLPLDTTLILRVFIENSDLVKFAKFTPSEPQVNEDVERVRKFITQTTPQKAEAPAEETIPV